MYLDAESKETLENNSDTPIPNKNQNSSENYVSPMKSRQATIERLDLKGIAAYEKSSTSDSSPTLVSSIEDPQKDILKNNEEKEIHSNPGSQNSKGFINNYSNKNEDYPLHLHINPPPQDFFMRKEVNGDQSPIPQKSQNVAPLEFSIVLGSNLLSNHREEPLFGSHSNLDTSKLRNHSRLSTDYTILEVLGKGSFGKVYKCVNNLDKNEYAVKEMLRKFAGRYKLYSLGETKMMALITNIDDNAHIVRYYHAWVEFEKLFLVMEYCPSSLSKERKQKGQLNEAELKKLLKDICLGLEFLHKNDIVHWDVKPENILISSTKKYKLADMGQAKNLSEPSTDLGEGDCRYLADEALNSKKNLDSTKVDIFSLGMTLYELSTNKELPKNGEEWHQIRNGELHELDKVTHLSEKFKDLIKLMINKDPSKRPSAFDILHKFLPDEEELELKWQLTMKKALELEHEDLEKHMKVIERRRKSTC